MNTMTHDEALQRLHAAADGLLSQSERAALDAHLAACADCRARAAQLASLQLALSRALRMRWDARPLPANLPRKVLNRARRASVRQPILRVAGALAGVAALIALIFFFSVLFGGPRAGPGASQTEAVPPATAAPARIGGANGLIVFQSERDHNPEIYVMRADGSGQTNLTNSPAADIAPAWSSDGARIAFISDRNGHSEIYLMNADGSDVTQVTDNPSVACLPPLSWSPEGTRLAVTCAGNTLKGQQVILEIFVVNADGSGLASVTNNRYSEFDPRWSPDGQRIAMIGGRYSTSVLDIIAPDGTAVATVVSGARNIGPIDWSPDGSRLAYFATARNRSGKYSDEIRIVNADGSNEETILTFDKPERPDYSDLAWSPDGTRLILTSAHEDNAEGSQQIYVTWADGSGLTRLTGGPASHTGPRWSPDGKWIVFTSDQDAPTDIYLMNVENAIRSPGALTSIRLTTTGKDHDPQWQPAGGPSVELAAQPSPVPTPTTAPAMRVLGLHQVQTGETVRCIAAAYGVSASVIVEVNQMGDPPQLHTGPLLIPDVKGEDYEVGRACSPQFPSPYSLDPVVAVPAPTTFLFTLMEDSIPAMPAARGCDWMGIGGQAFARNGEPLAGLIVHLEGAGLSREALTGGHPTYGRGGYEIQLDDHLATTTDVYRLQLRDLHGQPLSDWIVVDTFADCERNLLVVNFVQK